MTAHHFVSIANSFRCSSCNGLRSDSVHRFCEHVWVERNDEYLTDEDRTPVVCTVCGILGEHSARTNRVSWPIT